MASAAGMFAGSRADPDKRVKRPIIKPTAEGVSAGGRGCQGGAGGVGETKRTRRSPLFAPGSVN